MYIATVPVLSILSEPEKGKNATQVTDVAGANARGLQDDFVRGNTTKHSESEGSDKVCNPSSFASSF